MATAALVTEEVTMPVAILCVLLVVSLTGIIASYRIRHQFSEQTFTLSTLAFFFLFGSLLFVIRAQDEPSATIQRHSSTAIQDHIHDIYKRHGIADETLSLMESLTIGRRAELSRDQRESFRRAGASHILALSGFHVSILFALLSVLFMQGYSTMLFRRITSIIITCILWAYAYIAGGTPSIVRAVAMFSIYIITHNWSRNTNPINSCALAAAIILIADPMSIRDIGFQLSFVCVLGILLVMPYLASRHTHSLLIGHVIDIIKVSVVCNVFSMPLVAYHFHSIPLLSVLSSIVVTPIVLLFMYASVLWWLTLFITPINTLVHWSINMLSQALMTSVGFIASLPYSTFTASPTKFEVAILYICIGLVVYYLKGKHKRNEPYYLIRGDGSIAAKEYQSYTPLLIALLLFIGLTIYSITQFL